MTATTEENKLHQVLLIDLENCPSQIQQLQQSLENFSQVIICYAKSNTKIPLDWLNTLSKAIHQNKLKVFKMPNSGKNAADFGMCFFAGFLMAKLPKDTHFTIVSNDADLDHLVDLLISQGRSSKRIGTAPKKEPSEVPNLTQQEVLLLKKISLYLLNNTKNRPAKKESLLNTIKSLLKGDEDGKQKIFNLLVSHGGIQISNEKLIYNDVKLKELSI